MSTLTDASAFLRKRKDKRRALGAFPRSGPEPQRRPLPATSNLSGRSSGVGSPAASPSAGPSTKPEVKEPNPNVVEIKLFSGNADNVLRWNMAKFNSIREFDPASLESPLFTRKLPGPAPPPVFAQDAEGNIRGKYVYDPNGAPVLGADGVQVIEETDGRDANLIGGKDPRLAGKKKAVKEVYNQDKEKMRLKREEATPWVLECGQQVEGQEAGVQWVGRLQEATTLPSVLLINDGVADGFRVVPLGRTYRFEPDRPFNVNDPDEANRQVRAVWALLMQYEYQMKHRIYDRWGNAPAAGGARPQPNGNHGLAVPGRDRDVKPKLEDLALRQEERAQRWERQFQLDAAQGTAGSSRGKPQQSVQKWEDDDKREGRKLTRGMEGGVDEELDYDVNEEFQDDEDVNTFYRDPEEEEEAKLQEERQKKEYRLANANVGDKPQIEEELSDEDDLFGENELTAEGRRLKRMMKKRRDPKDRDDLFGSDSDDDSDDSEVDKPETPKKPDPTSASRGASAGPSSAERLSRPPSRTHSRNATSPIPKRAGAISGGKAVTAPPGSGHSLAAQRAASRGASPRRSRGNSPAGGRAASPDDRRSPGVGPREGSPAGGRGMSPASRASPAREASPAAGPSRASPGLAGGQGKPSPGGAGGKRKPSPVPQGDPSRKKKKSSTPRGSGTPTPGPEDILPFPGMIQRQDVIAWFRTQPALVPMTTAIGAWKDQILAAPTKEQQTQNQGIFLSIVSGITEKEPNKMLRMKAEYRQ